MASVRLLNCTPREAREAVCDNLEISPCVGLGADLMSDEWKDSIEEAATGVRLLVIDTLTRFHSLDENSGADAKTIMSVLEYLANFRGPCILYLHHVSKASAMGGMTELQQAARGSSVFVDNARWLSFVAGMSEEEAKKYGVTDRKKYVRWNISKQNYGTPGDDEWYQRGEGGVLRPIDWSIIGKPAIDRRRKDGF